MQCGNCGAKLSCGCQKITGANGKQCCTSCIGRCNQVAGVQSPVPPQQANNNNNQVSYPPGPYRT